MWVIFVRFAILLLAVFVFACRSSSGTTPPGDYDGLDNDRADIDAFSYGVPLDPASPWPKFRRDPAQTGASPHTLKLNKGLFWRFRTGKGIFSSPVIGADGTIYIGSADRNFYAIRPDGTEKWRFTTGEIIDSAALLDDTGRVYFGSGDGYLYALNRADGSQAWRFAADDPAATRALINWFEGNVAMGPGGVLYAPNDNFRLYAVDRTNGARVWAAKVPDQGWSLPAVDLANARLVVGNLSLLPFTGDTFGFDLDGRQLWKQQTKGSIAASPLLLPDGAFVLGGFDGYVRVRDGETGDERTNLPVRDHVYASAALHPAGFVVVPAADGTVYAFDPATGAVRWAFDWDAPIRSSPAIDGDGLIYMGTGNGHLLVLNAAGELHWAIRLVDEDRDDLNGSPGLGWDAVYVAGESGEVFSVPFEFCLRPGERTNPRCRLGPDEPGTRDESRLLYTTVFGTTLETPPAAVGPHDAAAFTLRVRAAGDTRAAFIDRARVTIAPEQPVETTVSADRRFVTVVPQAAWRAGGDGKVTIAISADVVENAEREGLRFFGGTPAGKAEATFGFAVAAPSGRLPLVTPEAGGEQTRLEMSRLAAPLPTLLPSYNQIGFDSLHFIIGFVAATGDDRGLAFVVEGKPDAAGAIRIDPQTKGMFALEYTTAGSSLKLINGAGTALQVMNATIGFDSFRVAGTLDANLGGTAGVTARAVCSSIQLYGNFLRSLGLCNPDTDRLTAYGAVLLSPYQGGRAGRPGPEVPFPTIVRTDTGLQATVPAPLYPRADHAFALLVADSADLRPVAVDYARNQTVREVAGNVQIDLAFGDVTPPSRMTIWLLIDAYPIAKFAM